MGILKHNRGLSAQACGHAAPVIETRHLLPEVSGESVGHILGAAAEDLAPKPAQAGAHAVGVHPRHTHVGGNHHHIIGDVLHQGATEDGSTVPQVGRHIPHDSLGCGAGRLDGSLGPCCVCFVERCPIKDLLSYAAHYAPF